MADAIRYRILPGTTGDKLKKVADLGPARATALVYEICERGRANIVERQAVGHTGALRGGYSVEVRRRGTTSPIGIIANPIIYHDPADEGRKPGRRPPVEALIPWVGSKLGIPPGPERRSVAFLIARKIGAKGTTGPHAVEEGWKETRAEIKPMLKEYGLRMIAGLK